MEGGGGGGGSVDWVGGGSVDDGAGSAGGSVDSVGGGSVDDGAGSADGSVDGGTTTGGSASLPDAVEVELNAAPAASTKASTSVTPMAMIA